MATQGLNGNGGKQQNLGFRPLDNSQSTQLKYELEAQHWDRAQRTVAAKNANTSFIGALGAVSSIFQLFFAIILFVFNIFAFLILGISEQFRLRREEREDDQKRKDYLAHLDAIIASRPRPKEVDDSEFLKY